jgi:hypothetical protein
MAQFAEVKVNGNKWKTTHCISPTGTDLSILLGTVPE